MLSSKHILFWCKEQNEIVLQDGSGVYKPPKFAPTAMEEDKMSKQEKNTLRKEQQMMRQAKQSAYVRDLIDDLEGRPEEVS